MFSSIVYPDNLQRQTRLQELNNDISELGGKCIGIIPSLKASVNALNLALTIANRRRETCLSAPNQNTISEAIRVSSIDIARALNNGGQNAAKVTLGGLAIALPSAGSIAGGIMVRTVSAVGQEVGGTLAGAAGGGL